MENQQSQNKNDVLPYGIVPVETEPKIEVPVIQNITKSDKKPKKKRLAPKKEAFCKSCEAVLGNITVSCEQVGISRQTFYEWYKTDPEFKERIDTISERIKDFAESSLHKQMTAGNTVATIFYLKSKAKDRGYGEEMKIEHSGNININLIETPVDMIKNDRLKNKPQTEGNPEST